MEYKFKKGDRVVAVESSKYNPIKKGWKGMVVELSDVPYVKWDGVEGKWAIDQGSLELYNPTPLVKIAVSFENDSEKMAYLRYCESIGKVWNFNRTKPTSWIPASGAITFDCFELDEQDELGHSPADFYKNRGFEVVPFKVFASLKGIDYTPIVEVKLNDTHTATIENGKVKVGCQTFEFDRIEALYNAVKEATK